MFFLRFFIFNFRESPKFLVYNGKDEQAIRVLEHIAKVNGVQCRLNYAAFKALTDESSHSSGVDGHFGPPSSGSDHHTRVVLNRRLSGGILHGGAKTFKRIKPSKQMVQAGKDRFMMLFSSFTMTRLTILVWLTYIMDFWGFTVAG